MTHGPVCSKRCCFVAEHGTVVTTSCLVVERAEFARVSPSTDKACDGDWQCAVILVTVYICGMNDNVPFYDQYLIR